MSEITLYTLSTCRDCGNDFHTVDMVWENEPMGWVCGNIECEAMK